MGHSSSKPNFHPSITDDLSTYQRLLHLSSPYAAPLQYQILQRLHNEPVTELDVQALWALDSPDWIDATLFNIVKFDVLTIQPEGGYVHLFIETEMMRYEHGAARWMADVYERHRRVVEKEAEEKRRQRGLGRIVRRGVDRGMAMLGVWVR